MATRRLRRILGWPLRRLLDRRVEWLIAALDERIGLRPGRPTLHHRLDEMEEVARGTEVAVAELALGRRLAALAGRRDGPLPTADAPPPPAAPGSLPADTAAFLDWAEGPDGPAARAGVWFNPPVAVRYRAQGAEVWLVNERIVEQPYVFGALAALPVPERVLDVGGGESTVGLSLATLGHEVHLVDPRGSPLSHPNLHVHRLRLEQLADARPFDAAVALSAIEHFGLGAYGVASEHERLDLAALADIRARLVPGGLLVLTVPCAAEGSVDEFQRVYAPEELRRMLAEWEIAEMKLFRRRDLQTWEPGEPGVDPGVALVSARRR
jgi:hypothetical protein